MVEETTVSPEGARTPAPSPHARFVTAWLDPESDDAIRLEPEIEMVIDLRDDPEDLYGTF